MWRETELDEVRMLHRNNTPTTNNKEAFYNHVITILHSEPKDLKGQIL